MISSLIRQIRSHKKELGEIEKQIQKLLPHFGYKLESMKGISFVTSAELIAEIGDINRFHSSEALAKYSGVAPVMYSSGKTDKMYCNKLGDRRLNKIFFSIAVTVVNPGQKGRPVNKLLYDYYHKKLSEGKTKKQALKSVMRRIVNIVYAMMRDKTEYRHPS